MKISAYCGNSFHAPENSLIALISGYTSGATILEFQVRITKDKQVIVCNDESVERLTNTPGLIREMTVNQLQKLNFAATFKPRNSPSFVYYNPEIKSRRATIETLPDLLDHLPEDAELLIELKYDQSGTIPRELFVSETVRLLADRGYLQQTVIYSRDSLDLALARETATQLGVNPSVAIFKIEISEEGLRLMDDVSPDGLVTELEGVLDSAGTLTKLGQQVKERFESGSLGIGAILHPRDGVFKRYQYEALKSEAFVWSISTRSMIDVSTFIRRHAEMVNHSFLGQNIDLNNFALGYAMVDSYTKVYQDNGIHIEIGIYDKPITLPPPVDEVDRRLRILENKMTNVAKEWPFYSGGGLGVVKGILGDFYSEVDYTVENVAQSTTLEMAALNVDPGLHQFGSSRSLRDRHSFYDPHGAPPYVGVEHDEDDGFRINWNLGSGYDSNKYGKPVGDGKLPRGARLRLERRGACLAAYYRDPTNSSGKSLEPMDWVCVGVVRNDSLNPLVYLRCVGKRWRKIKSQNPIEYWPIVPNHFTFRNLRIVRFPTGFSTTHRQFTK